MQNSESLRLKFGLSFEDLYRREGLLRIDAAFADHLKAIDADLFRRLMDARAQAAPRKQLSELMVDLAPHVEDFIGDLFGIAADVRPLQPATTRSRRFMR